MSDRNEPINYGALDAAQRLELARNPELFAAKRRIAELERASGSLVISKLLPDKAVASNTQPARQVGEYGDAYQGAREDLAIWKRRALEAEATLRQKEQIIDSLVLEAQGETRMGEPLISVARQVGGDEREQFEAAATSCGVYACNFERYTELTAAHENKVNGDIKRVEVGDYRSATLQDGWKLWQARAALAPAAACVMPERQPVGAYKKTWNDALDEVARLNRNPIPVDLLERVSKLFPEDMGDDGTGRAGWLPHVRDTVGELRALLAQQQEGGEGHE